jgi:hypothetical protein
LYFVPGNALITFVTERRILPWLWEDLRALIQGKMLDISGSEHWTIICFSV